MRNLKGLAAASVAMLAASCTPVHAEPSQEQQSFCYGTADVVFHTISARHKWGSLDAVMQMTDEVLAKSDYTTQQRAAVRRAVRFGWFAPANAHPVEFARYQYIGCLATEI